MTFVVGKSRNPVIRAAFAIRESANAPSPVPEQPKKKAAKKAATKRAKRKE